MNNIVIKPFETYMCVCRIRGHFEGKTARHALEKYQNKIILFKAIRKQARIDPYPGEWVMEPVQDFPISWIASGDLEVLGQVEPIDSIEEPARKHVIKHEYVDGVKLINPTVWCGEEQTRKEWRFRDAQHAALTVYSNAVPCKKCIKAIINQLIEGL